MIREFQEEIMRLKEELAQSGGDIDPLTLPPEMRHLAGGPAPPPRIQKEIVTVEKEVEKIVEKEIIIEKGPTPEELAAMQEGLRAQNEQVRMEAERKRHEIEAQRDMAEAERRRFL